MTYTPINWQTGDTITAEKMNKMDNGWGVESTQILSETVTTQLDMDDNIVGQLAYSQPIDYSTITVTLNGTSYECNRLDAFGGHFYGGFSEQGPDFSNYPFFIFSGNFENMLYTETAGTYAIAVIAGAIQVSSNFTTAVKATGMLFQVIEDDTTWQEVLDAVIDGKLAYFVNWGLGETGIVSAGIGYIADVSWVILAGGTTYNVRTVGIDSNGNIQTTHLQASSADGVLAVVS